MKAGTLHIEAFYFSKLAGENQRTIQVASDTTHHAVRIGVEKPAA